MLKYLSITHPSTVSNKLQHPQHHHSPYPNSLSFYKIFNPELKLQKSLGSVINVWEKRSRVDERGDGKGILSSCVVVMQLVSIINNSGKVLTVREDNTLGQQDQAKNKEDFFTIQMDESNLVIKTYNGECFSPLCFLIVSLGNDPSNWYFACDDCTINTEWNSISNTDKYLDASIDKKTVSLSDTVTATCKFVKSPITNQDVSTNALFGGTTAHLPHFALKTSKVGCDHSIIKYSDTPTIAIAQSRDRTITFCCDRINIWA